MSALSVPSLSPVRHQQLHSDRLFTIRQKHSHLYGVQLTHAGPAYVLAFISREDCHHTRNWLQYQHVATGSWPQYACRISSELKLESATLPNGRLLKKPDSQLQTPSEGSTLFVNPITLPGLLGIAATVHIAMIEKADCSRFKVRLHLREMIELQLGLDAFRMHLLNRNI